MFLAGEVCGKTLFVRAGFNGSILMYGWCAVFVSVGGNAGGNRVFADFFFGTFGIVG